jgi:hypothetical protein
MNYTDLTQAIQDYHQDDETTFVNNIPNFIRQAEERIFREVIVPELRQNATGSFTSSNRYLQKPTDYLSTISVSVNDGTDELMMQMKEVSFIYEAYPDNVEGVPKFYAHFGDDCFIVGPTPDSGYAAKIHYYYDPPSIVTSGTSWLGDNAETALLNACLVESYVYQKGEADLMQVYNERYTTALNNLEALGSLRIRRDEYREGNLRIEA